MAGRRMLVFFAAALSGACTARSDPDPAPDPAPIPAPAPLPVADPEVAPTPVPAPTLAPAPTSVAAGGCHPTLRAACFEFEGDSVLDDESCGESQSGVMPDHSTRYHLIRRWWSGTRLAQLLVLESDGCFTLIGDLGWNTLNTQLQSTKLKTLDLDKDGKDEAVFRIVEFDTNPDTGVERTIRTARYCRETAGTWTCTETLSRRPRATDWPD